jgi:hypothetical protein
MNILPRALGAPPSRVLNSPEPRSDAGENQGAARARPSGLIATVAVATTKEDTMSTTRTRTQTIAEADTGNVDLKLEATVIPVSDVDRAKAFSARLGWRLDADVAFDNGFRVVQFTPPGSAASVQFGTKITTATPGSAQGLYLIVSDIEAARDALVYRGSMSAKCSTQDSQELSSRPPTRAPG